MYRHHLFRYLRFRQMHLGTDTTTCDQDKARLFNSYSYSVFNDKDLTNDSLTITNETSGTSLSDIVITAEDVHEALVSLDPNKAMGPDGISPKVLKYCTDALCQPISYLFQLTITNSYLPSEWRTYCVIPIFKCGDRATISNYRPISLLCIISKVLEKIIFNRSSFYPTRLPLINLAFYLVDLPYSSCYYSSMNYWKRKEQTRYQMSFI